MLPPASGVSPKRRSSLLGGGVMLFEFKRSNRGATLPRFHLGGSAASSLHAKTFSVDGRRVFVGSFNFDPRSERLNTELGFVIESPVLAQTIADAFTTAIPEGSYRVQLGRDGLLKWVEGRPDNLRVTGRSRAPDSGGGSQ